MPKSAATRRTLKPPKRTSRPFGAHQSIAGGFVKAVDRAVETGCECLQIFTRNINRWDVAAIDPQDALAFRAAVRKAGLACVVAEATANVQASTAALERGLTALAATLERLGEETLVVEVRPKPWWKRFGNGRER